MALVVDDHLLLDLLAGSAPTWLTSELESSAVYTTSGWYYRVALAFQRGTGSGSLSGRLAVLDPEQAQRLVDTVAHLPDWVGLIGPRVLVPVMAALVLRRRPNWLTAEALAVALVTESTICVTVDAPLLRDGAEDLGVPIRRV
jgi:hypothetical protein